MVPPIRELAHRDQMAAVFDGYDMARVWHFWLMWLFIFFVVPHVILVFSDGWLRSLGSESLRLGIWLALARCTPAY
jgi:thiosulfate reductase cytochrome b subunit